MVGHYIGGIGSGWFAILRSKSVTKRSGRASHAQEKSTMSRLAIWAQLEAKPGKEKEVEEFLKSAQPLAERESATLSWYAIKMGPGKYGIFDTFADENGRNAHLNGEIAKALFAKAKDLFSKPPDVAKPEILAAKSIRD
jgi:quinol monooxygenase YgiN